MKKNSKIKMVGKAQKSASIPKSASIQNAASSVDDALAAAMGEPAAKGEPMPPRVEAPSLSFGAEDLREIIADAVVSALLDVRVLQAFACVLTDTSRLPGKIKDIGRRRISEVVDMLEVLEGYGA